MSDDKRTISMPFEVYKKDLSTQRELGKDEALERLRYVLAKRREGEFKEAYLVLLEDFGNLGHLAAIDLGIKVDDE